MATTIDVDINLAPKLLEHKSGAFFKKLSNVLITTTSILWYFLCQSLVFFNLFVSLESYSFHLLSFTFYYLSMKNTNVERVFI